MSKGCCYKKLLGCFWGNDLETQDRNTGQKHRVASSTWGGIWEGSVTFLEGVMNRVEQTINVGRRLGEDKELMQPNGHGQFRE